MNYIPKYYLAVLSLIFFLGCDTIKTKNNFPDLRYTHLPTISLSVSKVEVVNKYQPKFKKPNVESEFPILPSVALRNWFNDRLSASGGSDFIRATVLNASVVEVPLKRRDGIRGIFTRDQTERYDAVLSAKIEIFDSLGVLKGTVSSKAKNSQTVAEGTTLAKRELIWFTMLEAMMKDLNRSLENQIRKFFKPWLT